mgnify:CR=1 FL=1
MTLGPDRQCQLSAKPSSFFVLAASGQYRGNSGVHRITLKDRNGSIPACPVCRKRSLAGQRWLAHKLVLVSRFPPGPDSLETPGRAGINLAAEEALLFN